MAKVAKWPKWQKCQNGQSGQTGKSAKMACGPGLRGRVCRLWPGALASLTRPGATGQSHEAEPQPRTTSQSHSPEPQPRATAQIHRPDPQARSTGMRHRHETQTRATDQGHRPAPQARTTGRPLFRPIGSLISFIRPVAARGSQHGKQTKCPNLFQSPPWKRSEKKR